MSYTIHTEAFEGPFDLLLHLIARHKVDINDLDLAEITSDFLAFLADLDELDLDTATRFLVVAATLIELKAARLLPREDREELEDLLGDARDLLYARLLEYRAFRHAAGVLEGLVADNAAYHARSAPIERRYASLVPDAPLPVDPAGLAAIAARVTAPKPPPKVDTSHVHVTYLTVRQAAAQVLERVRGLGERVRFRELVAGRSRADKVVLFLALLELYKLGHLALDQHERFGSLEIERQASELDLEALDAAEADLGPLDDGDASAEDVADDRSDDSRDGRTEPGSVEEPAHAPVPR